METKLAPVINPKGAIAFDPVVARAAAEEIATHAARIPALFETPATDPKSEAHPAIWQDFDDFAAKARDLEALCIAARHEHRNTGGPERGTWPARSIVQSLSCGVPALKSVSLTRRASGGWQCFAACATCRNRRSFDYAFDLPDAGTYWYHAHANSMEQVARGSSGALIVDGVRQICSTHCASCHGADLEGQPDWQVAAPDGVLPTPPHDETGHTWHHETQLLFDYVKIGGAEILRVLGVDGFPSGMPGFAAQLSDDDIYDVLAFIRSTWTPRARAIQRARDPVHE